MARDPARDAARDPTRVAEAAGAAQAGKVPRARWDAAVVAELEFVTELACTLRLPVRSAENLTAKNRTLQHELPPPGRSPGPTCNPG